MKVRCINAEALTPGLVDGKIYEGELVCDEGNKKMVWNIKGFEHWRFGKFRFEEAKELTFEEVIANIKDGEVWECTRKTARVKEIKKNGELKNSLIVFNFRCLTEDTRASIQGTDTFKLKRKKYTIEEAFKAFEEGKEMESCDGWKFKKKGDKVIVTNHSGARFEESSANALFSLKEMKGDWYINE